MCAAQRGPGRLVAERLEIQPGVAEGQVAGAETESRRGLVPEVPVSIGVADFPRHAVCSTQKPWHYHVPDAGVVAVGAVAVGESVYMSAEEKNTGSC